MCHAKQTKKIAFHRIFCTFVKDCTAAEDRAIVRYEQLYFSEGFFGTD